MPKASPESPIIVAGGGPVGMLSALLLARAGQPVILLESAEVIQEDMRASTFHSATLDILDEVGLADPLIALGSTATRWQYMVHETGERAVFDLSILQDITRHTYRLQCEQFHLTRLIAACAESEPLFDLRLGWAVTDVEPYESGVRVSVRHEGGEETLDTPWLIGADGAHSSVRNSLNLPFSGTVFPKTSITMVIRYPLEQHVPELLGVNYVWTRDAHYRLMQIRDLWRFTYSPQIDASIEHELDESVALAKLHSVFPDVGAVPILQLNHYTLHQRCLESFRLGRIMFAGDAAHLNSPAGGMGMNSGLHDAVSLVEHLLAVLAGGEESLLERYDRRRRTIAQEEVQRLSSRNYQRHRETDEGKRGTIWSELKAITQDDQRMRDFLMRSSMIHSRAREREIQ